LICLNGEVLSLLCSELALDGRSRLDFNV
jgi:hypothetical protein